MPRRPAALRAMTALVATLSTSAAAMFGAAPAFAADTSAPQLTSFAVHAPPNATTGDTLSADYTTTDDSGSIDAVSFRYSNAIGGSFSLSSDYAVTTALTGTTNAAIVNSRMVSGAYTLQGITVLDAAGNTTTYNRDGSTYSWPSGLSGARTHAFDLRQGDFTVTGTSALATSVEVDVTLGSTGPVVQSGTVLTGKVTSLNGDPTGKVIATVKGSSSSTTAPVLNGGFSITVPDFAGDSAVLVLRFTTTQPALFLGSELEVIRTKAMAPQPGPGAPPVTAPAPGPSTPGTSTPAPSTTPPSSPPTSSPDADTGLTSPGVHRVSGDDRLATSIAASRAAFPRGAKAAVLTSSVSYADALAGGRLASAVGGPLLLTDPEGLRDDVARELHRLLSDGATVYLLGGRAALGVRVEAQVTAAGLHPERLAGDDRFSTAVAVAEEVTRADRRDGNIYLASGTDFPDGLAVAALAAETGGVVLLTDGSAMPAATAAYIGAHDPAGRRSVAVGGPAAAAAPAAAVKLVGGDRYETAAKVAAQFAGTSRTVGVARGTSWADALVGAAVMGHLGGPLLLTDGHSLSDETRRAVEGLGATSAVVIGGRSAVSSGAYEALSDLL